MASFMEDALVAQFEAGREEARRAVSGAAAPLSGAEGRERPAECRSSSGCQGWNLQAAVVQWAARYHFNFVGFRDHREIYEYAPIFLRGLRGHHHARSVAELPRSRP
jgi:hypothetical protein